VLGIDTFTIKGITQIVDIKEIRKYL
jgi:hypothetical protein